MTDTTTANAENATATPAASGTVEQSLEDVYKEAGVPEAKPQPQEQYIAPVVAKVAVPDAYDEGHRGYLEKQQERMNALEAHQNKQLHAESVKTKESAEAKLVEDINVATKFIVDNAGFKDLPYSDEAKATLANSELESKAKSDPKFQALWRNRDANPEAWGKALAIVTKDIARKFEAKVDPKLAADRRALRASQGSSATSEQDGQGANPLEGLEGAAFERAWNNIARGRNN
jgi:hypothetical protein